MEYNLVNRRHQHPLLFIWEEDDGRQLNEDEVVCSRCRQQLDPPAFTCSDSDCNFHIHQSCLHLPPQIHTHFHPQHPLDLSPYNWHSCDACGQKPSSCDQVYKCNSEECNFKIDIKCAMADTIKANDSGLLETGSGKYQHFSHPHPLTLKTTTLEQQGDYSRGGEILIMKKLLVCFICELLIKSHSSTYFCSQCDTDDDVHFHKQCAELPRVLQNSDFHPHPLLLRFTEKRYDAGKVMICNSCRKQCIGFVYTCLFSCKFFFLHVACLRSCNHKHTFANMLKHKTDDLECQICGEKSEINRFLLLCDICHILVHRKCAEFPSTLRIHEHSHDLTFNYFPPDHADKIFRCKICGKEINTKYAGYSCLDLECNYFTHLDCAHQASLFLNPDPHAVAALINSPTTHDYYSTENEKLAGAGAGADAKKDQIKHFSHDPHHDLTLFSPENIREDRVCDGCFKCLSVSGPSYGCDQLGECDFFLHEQCASLPTTINRRHLHPHNLNLISIPNFIFQCEACLNYFHGFAYHCKTCFSTFDVRCASIETPFKHPNHQHSLYLLKINKGELFNYSCGACGEKIIKVEGPPSFGCSECGFYLHIGCATLPVIVRYRFDPHPLKLTFVEEERRDDYYCDICEEEREVGLWFYNCRECSFTAHPSCALGGKFPYVKSAMHKSHRHPLNLSLVVMKLEEEEGGSCGSCNKSCAGNLAFQCSACKFNVHAIGGCYDLQVQEGNLAFTNHNVFSRANQSGDYDHQIKWPIVVTLGPFGGRSPSMWKERVFSTICGFVVYHDESYIYCIQIQYRKNGELVLSKHGKEKGTKDEVAFDYPDEYLASIHGSHAEGDIIRSLTLQTNRKTYGPFGVEREVKFSSVKEGVKIVGIFGFGSYCIERVGFEGILSKDE